MQYIRDAAPTVMTHNGKAINTKMCHHSDHVLRQCSFRVRRVVWRGGRTTALTIASQVGAHDGVVVGKRRRDTPPHQMGFGKAVKKEERRTASSRPHEDRRVARVDLS